MLEVFEIPPPEERDSTIARNTEAMNIVFLTDPANAYLTYEQRLKILGLYNEGKEQEANALILAWTGETSRRNATALSYNSSREFMALQDFYEMGVNSIGPNLLDNLGNLRNSYFMLRMTQENLNRLNNMSDSSDIFPDQGFYVNNASKGSGSKANPNEVKVNQGQQDKHIKGTKNYNQEIANGRPRSILKADPQELLDNYAGTGQIIGSGTKERVDFGKIIGQYYNSKTGRYENTTRGIIHYDSKGTAHIVPSAPNGN